MRIIRKAHVFILICMLLTFMISCDSGNESSNKDTQAGPIKQKYTELLFKNIELGDTPTAIQKWLEENKAIRQNKVFNVDGKTYVLILVGQKINGAYNVEITQIRETTFIQDNEVSKGGIKVSHEVTELANDSATTQAVTYPHAIAEMDGEMDGEMDESFQFSMPLTEEELDEMIGDDPNHSVSSDLKSKSDTERGGAKTELVPPENLMKDGKVKGDKSPGFETQN